MAGKLTLAQFEELKSARAAMSVLREKGFTVHLDRNEERLPDPDFSVSAMMVGFLPDLAHGIFGTNDKKVKIDKADAHLIISVSDEHGQQLAKSIIDEFGGKLIESRIKQE